MVNSGRPVSMSIGDRVMRDGAVKLPKPKKSASSEIASTAVPVGSGGVSVSYTHLTLPTICSV